MNEIPWYALSPSPFSIAFYLILISYAYLQIRKRRALDTRRKKVIALTECFFLVGLVVVFLDTFWIMVSGLRWAFLYPDDLFQLGLAAGRNIAAVALCLMFVGDYFKIRLIRINNYTRALFLLNFAFLSLWFVLSPSPAYTDFTFAIRHGYPENVVLGSFLISHLIGKSIVAGIFKTIWQNKHG